MKLKRRPLLLTGLALVLIPAAAYLLFELGRYEAGYSILDRQRQTEQYERDAAARQRTIEELKRQLAILETSREIDRATYAQVETTLSELEQKNQAQEEELAFYRGIISPPDGVSGLRIQSLSVEPTNFEQHFTLRLVLMQAIAHSRRVSGVVKVKLTGTRGEETQALTLEDLTAGDGVSELSYGFRYFQGLEQQLVLPDGFTPATIEVEITPTEPKGETSTQSFQWSTVGG